MKSLKHAVGVHLCVVLHSRIVFVHFLQELYTQLWTFRTSVRISSYIHAPSKQNEQGNSSRSPTNVLAFWKSRVRVGCGFGSVNHAKLPVLLLYCFGAQWVNLPNVN